MATLRSFSFKPLAPPGHLPFFSLRPKRWRLELVSFSSSFSPGRLRFVSRSSDRRRRCTPIKAKATDYYGTLNLSRNSTLQEIKSAYRSLARKVRMFFVPYSVASSLAKSYCDLFFSFFLIKKWKL